MRRLPMQGLSIRKKEREKLLIDQEVDQSGLGTALGKAYWINLT
jgi:hypothetical protein